MELTVNGLTFDEWRRRVNAVIEGRVGVSLDDLPDVSLWDWWDAGDSPREAARAALREAGWSN